MRLFIEKLIVKYILKHNACFRYKNYVVRIYSENYYNSLMEAAEELLIGGEKVG